MYNPTVNPRLMYIRAEAQIVVFLFCSKWRMVPEVSDIIGAVINTITPLAETLFSVM
jgi:hypothetical protein